MTAASTTEEVVRGVRDLAARRGWKPVDDLAARILSPGSGREILLALGAGVDAAPLREWIQQVSGTAGIAEEPIEQIAAPPFRALSAAKLVAVLECGRVLEAREVKVIAEQFLPRPLESFAIVFTRAERLESSEDLDLMERAIWRVVVPDPKRDWQRQDLLAYQCYFWTSSEPKEFLRDRCRRDREELAAVLRRPIGEADAESLDRGRAVWLVEFAVEFAPSGRPRGDVHTARLRQARDEIAEARRRLARRLDADAAGLGRQATTSLLRLEQDLLWRMEETRKSQTGLWKDTHVYSREFQKLLERRLAEGMAAWRKVLEAELNQRVTEIIAETQGLLRRVDWDFVNGIAGNPERTAAQAPMVSAAARIPDLEHPIGSRERQWIDRVSVAAQATGLLGLAAAMSAGLLAMIAVSGILTAATVRRRARSFDQTAQPARQAIHAMTKRAIPDVRTAIQIAIADYRDRLVSGLREIETELEAACARAFEATAAETAADSDREQLLLYRRRL
jgi:hypothetical protein